MDRGPEIDVIHFHRIFTTIGLSARMVFSTLVPPVRNDLDKKMDEASLELCQGPEKGGGSG